MDKATELSEALRRDGFAFFRDFLSVDEVKLAYREIDMFYQSDLQERMERGISAPHHIGVAGHSVLTKPTHLLLDIYGKSPALDRLFERILTDPVSAAVLRELVGDDIKLRGYNCTRLTGEYDPGPSLGPAPNPHEWHRDSYGEIGFGIFLSDFSEPNQGSTALMKGSHIYPFCPRWNCLFGEPYHNGLRIFLRLNLFSRLLARKVKKNVTGAYGKRGDFYIFINDTWHGRQPNLNGHEGLRIMIGAFAADAPYPDHVPDLPLEVLNKLPPKLREVAPQPRPTVRKRHKPILDHMMSKQKALSFHPLFVLTRLERKLADLFSSLKQLRRTS